MNLADAIRQASQSPAPVNQAPSFAVQAEANVEARMEDKTTFYVNPAVEDEQIARDAVTSEPVRMPEPISAPVANGSIVRLELFLTPEQLSGLFRAVVANQHSMMTVREAASYLRVHANVLEQMAQEGEIPAFQIDGRWRFPKQGIDEWLTLQSFRKESA